MATPSKKHPSIRKLLDAIMGTSTEAMIKTDECVACHKEATRFRDELSRKEFCISGLCQSCQDEVFGKQGE